MNRKENHQRAVTADCGVEGLAHLKTFHPIPDFRIGGTYNLDDPSSWESGGTGGTTLESLGEGPLAHGLHCRRHASPGQRRVHRQRRHLQPLLLRRCGPDVLLLVPRPGGKRLLRRPCRGSRGADRHGSILRHLPRCPRPLGCGQTERRPRPQVPAIQPVRLRPGQLPDAAGSPEGEPRQARHGGLHGGHPELSLGPAAPRVCRGHHAHGGRYGNGCEPALALPAHVGGHRERPRLARNRGGVLSPAEGRSTPTGASCSAGPFFSIPP